MHFKFKKSLGQNFLIDKNIVDKIVDSVSNFKQSESLLEIGAGSGLLTGPLSKIYNKIFAIELDRRMCAILEVKFCGNKDVEVICQDFLKLNISKLTTSEIDVFGNIPYYITGPIFMRLFNFKDKIKLMFLTVQKEVARRMLADSGSKDYGFFSCLVQYFTEPKVLFHIKKNSFKPAPKVDSTFLLFKIKKTILNQEQEAKFIKIISCAFSQRRKTILNALSPHYSKALLESCFNRIEVKPTFRPEQIKLDSYIKLTEVL